MRSCGSVALPGATPPARQVLARVLAAWGLACVLGYAVAQGLVVTQAVLEWMEQEYGTGARQRVEALGQMIERSKDAPELGKLERANDFFNRMRYATDNDLWDRKDYWATPFEALGINSADCEDYALSKYFALVSMGIPEDKLRITYVKAVTLGEAHMVLAYYPEQDAEPLILDNLTDRIRPAGERTDLVPVYSFNGASLWLAVNRVEGRKVGGSDRINLWQQFQKRLSEQLAQAR